MMMPALNVPQPPPASPIRRSPPAIAMGLYLVYLFLVISRAQEVLLPVPKLVIIFGSLTLLTSFTAGLPVVALLSRSGLLITGFAAMMLASVPLSYWPGGSVNTFIDWIPYALLFVIGAHLLTTVRAVRTAMTVLAIATFFSVAMTFILGESSIDRASLEQSSLGNANDLSMVALFGIPFWLVFMRKPGVRPFRVVAGSVAIVLSMIVVLKTGSRSGFLTLAVVFLIMLVRTSGPKKIALLFVAGLMGAYTSSAVWTRLAVMFEDRRPVNEDIAARAARESMDQRGALLKQSIRLTFQHPITGVGLGQFATAASELAKSQGRRGDWAVTHNSYTQVSSELGLPGFLIYVAILVSCFRVTRNASALRGRTPDGDVIADLVAALRMALIVYCLASAFLSVAYIFYVPVLAAFAAGLRTISADTVLTPEANPAAVPAAPALRIPPGRVAPGQAVSSLSRYRA